MEGVIVRLSVECKRELSAAGCRKVISQPGALPACREPTVSGNVLTSHSVIGGGDVLKVTAESCHVKISDVVLTWCQAGERQCLRAWRRSTSAAAVMMIAPILVLFLGLQRRFIEGLTQGGVKT